MSLVHTDSIILRKYDCRETSLILNFFTREQGKISGLLKGVRTEPAKFASSLELFSLNELIFYPKRNSSLHLVSACDLKDNFSALRGDISKVGVATVMMELIDAVMPPEDPGQDIFDLAVSCLQQLCVKNSPDKIAAIFKIKLLSLSGFKPHFDSCVSCNCRLLGEAKFSLSLGGMLCGGCYAKDPGARSIFRGTVASIMHIEKNDLSNNLNLGLNPQIKRELEAILNAFLNYHLGKELKSQKTFDKLAAVEI